MSRLCFFINFLLSILASSPMQGQQFAFRHLDVNSGLSSNIVAQAIFDHNGWLWFSTGEAMNLYDGNNITQFHWRNYPVMPQSETGFFSVDSDNRVWVCYLTKLILIDEKRYPGEYILHDTLKTVRITHCFEIKGLGMVAISDKGAYYTENISSSWKHLTWFDSLRKDHSFTLYNQYDPSSYLAKIKDRLLLINFKTGKVSLDISMPENVDVCKLNENEILAGVRYSWKLYRINIPEQRITKTYSQNIDQSGHPIIAELQNMEQAADGKVYFTTRYCGLIQFDPLKESFMVSKHDFLSEQSISSNDLRYLACSPDGYLAATSRSGINITNVFQSSFRSMEYFKDAKGNVIEEGVWGVIEDRKGKLWIMTLNSLLTLAPNKNSVDKLLDLRDISLAGIQTITPGIPAMDDHGKIWIPYGGYGILVYDDGGKLVERFSDQKGSLSLHDNSVRVIRKSANGKLYVGTNNGIFIIDPFSFKIDTTTLQPLVNSMEIKRVVDILEDGNSLWATTSPEGAVYNYDIKNKSVKKYTVKEGLVSKRNYFLTKNKKGDLYISSYNGVSVFGANGKLSVIDKNSGLTDIRAEAIVSDDSGYVWIANTRTLVRYDPYKNRFKYFGEQHGINKAGFMVTSSCKIHTGELVFGMNKGIVFVNPKLSTAENQPVKFGIYRINADNTIDICRSSEPLHLPYSNARITFSCFNSDIISGDRIFYRYKMEGLDTSWSASTKNHLITFKLSPGNYTYKMQASYNEIDWIDFPNSLNIKIKAPFWQQWWFYVLIGILAVGTTMIIYRSVQASKEQKRKLEELNRLMNESRLMAIRSQMNPHFIFNSLNAIQECIVMQDFDTAYQYLSKFSKLLRQVLNNSEKNFVPLKDEIEVNELYLELESLRFKNSFSFSLTVDESIDPETIKFPSLMLQPFIENAIWHGLMHKQGEKKLDISFQLVNRHLECVIEDNGVGREHSAEIKKNKLGAQYFESKGTQLSGQRIKLLNETGYEGAAIQIDDMKENGAATGTRVTLKIPLDHKN